MTYAQTIEYLYDHLPMFTRIGEAAYKKDLHNTIALLDVLGHPEQKFKSIHIAGTNGKGSTSHMLAAVFQANGYRVGLYTSPHLKDFRERIKTTGNAEEESLQMVTEDFVVQFVQKMQPHIATIQPSFFELTVAMAFEYFSSQNLDIAIIETGLGGRLDSTNVITPLLSIITNIGWDHMNILGDTLEKIAVEKAGIIKQNVPVVVGETLPETKAVFLQKAKLEQAPIWFAEALMTIHAVTASSESLEIIFNQQPHLQTWQTDLPGIYQQYNLRNILCALPILETKGFVFEQTATQQGLNNVKSLTGLMGRWQVIRQNPTLILDVAHNEDGIKQALLQLNNRAGIMKIHVVMGMVKDKEVEKVLGLLPTSFHYYFTNAHLPRALPAQALSDKANAFGLRGKAYDDVNTAIASALDNCTPADLVLVCGSVFVVGEVEVERFQP